MSECDPGQYTREECCSTPLSGDTASSGTAPPTSLCPLFCGPGSPEGKITAPVGAIYEQTDALTESHSVWIKITGTGNTGWHQWAGLRGGPGSNTNLRLGDFSVSTGGHSIAIGETAEATGASAVAIGRNTLASGARSEAFGEDSEATADDAKAMGVGAKASGARSIAIGPLAQADLEQGIAIGNGRARGANDILIGFDTDVGQELAHPNVIVGFNAEVGTIADSSSPTPSLRGGHVVIGQNASAGMGPSQFPNTVIGKNAKSVGRAVIVIGQNAEARPANTPVSGQVEGRFATIIGYLSKGSGGCIVSVGDQCDVRGDSTVAVGTHARANDNQCVALGPNSWAGSLTSDGSGLLALAVGSFTVTGIRAIGVGSGSVNAPDGIGIGRGVFIDALHHHAIAIGTDPATTGPRQLMLGSTFQPVHTINFRDSKKPFILIGYDGRISLVNPRTSTVDQPVTGNTALTDNEPVLLVDATGGVVTVTLPPSTGSGVVYMVRKEDASANKVTVVPSGADTIDGDASLDISSRFETVYFRDDGDPGFEWFSFTIDI